METDEIDDWDGEIDFKDLKGEIVRFQDSGKITGSRTSRPVVQLEEWGRNTGATRIGLVYAVQPRKQTVSIRSPPPTEMNKRLGLVLTAYLRVPKVAILECLKFDRLGGGADRIKIK